MMNDIFWVKLVLIGFFHLNLIFCCSLNDEGIALLKFRERVTNDPFGALTSWNEEIGEINPCPWFGIECDDGHVVSLNLKNLCLEGTLAPELHHLLHIKSIILRNNSFSGLIPEEIRNLKELELLDLGYNNFLRPLPPQFIHNIPILLFDHNGLSCHIFSKLEEFMFLSEVQVHNHLTSSVHNDPRILLDQSPTSSVGVKNNPVVKSPSSSAQQSQSKNADTISQPPPGPPLPPVPPPPVLPPNGPKNAQPQQPPSREPPSTPDFHPRSSIPGPVPSPTSPARANTRSLTPVVVGAVVGFIGLVLVIIGLLYLRRAKKFRMAGPQAASGLSGQLQKAFVAGIPNLKRSELETSCEEFSNVIGMSSIGTVYKGTLSNGVEIAVISLAATSSAKDWSKNLEKQFRRKVETLSKVTHKNFVNLIGYCQEEEPFARMMVFEYAPNGSLFEHLHVREAEHLDWRMRLRVAMGMAYCLEHMHQLTPPLTHPNLNSSSVSLSEDYAAKISDFCFWNEVAAAQGPPVGMMSSFSAPSLSPESNVCSFGLVLLEMMTGRIPHSLQKNSIEDWVSRYLEGQQTLRELVDPMLRKFNPEKLHKISELIKKCLHSEPQNRPTMRDVTARLREITGIDRDTAVPQLSSLWWAELDGRSVNGG